MKSQHQRFRNIVQGVACNLFAFAFNGGATGVGEIILSAPATW